MGKTIYLECNAGISGDMTVAALLDLGADEKKLRKALDSIPAQGYEIKISRVKKSGLDCMDFDVVLDAEHENHDHDMEYLHGTSLQQKEKPVRHLHQENLTGQEHQGNPYQTEQADQHQPNQHQLEQTQDRLHQYHQENQHPGHHHHVHRGLTEVLELIHHTELSNRAASLAEKIFRILAEAEAKAHGVPVSEVHFHEVGAIDSIVDVIAAAVCLDDLDITGVIVSRLCEGTGTVRCQHGVLPVPVPAVSNILEKYHIPVEWIPVQGEFVTPTGAAIVAAVLTDTRLPQPMIIQRVGMGAGKRTYERPSILRAMLIENVKAEGDTSAAGTISGELSCSDSIVRQKPVTDQTESARQPVCKLETDIDDCTGEAMGMLVDLLLEAGARDVYYNSVYMKKNRPGYQLNVICMPEELDRLQELIFRHTTTIGIRRQYMDRTVLERELRRIATPDGQATVKLCRNGNETYVYPEYESVADICKETGKPFQEVYQEIKKCGMDETKGYKTK